MSGRIQCVAEFKLAEDIDPLKSKEAMDSSDEIAAVPKPQCKAAPATPAPKRKRNRRRRAKSNRCMVIGCGLELSQLNKPYCLRKGICPSCMKSPAVYVEGRSRDPLRYCFQCAKLEPLSAFDGNKR
ncbi:hypothetical protein OEZ85_013623 [Tetradesmus obliquus]|uniref:SBP-type domain-containing protein n=1 Tax=Tetradesmus obliquus TaxID=3088 RepID=A0ABY8URD3_TETOB|nr:hypothetical protein OEZ85_013623 [Tetradesmus obliquus]